MSLNKSIPRDIHFTNPMLVSDTQEKIEYHFLVVDQPWLSVKFAVYLTLNDPIERATSQQKTVGLRQLSHLYPKLSSISMKRKLCVFLLQVKRYSACYSCKTLQKPVNCNEFSFKQTIHWKLIEKLLQYWSHYYLSQPFFIGIYKSLFKCVCV